jgi:tRNA-specific 2-thiouridylase
MSMSGKGKVLVGLSGGVDSSVAAALLKEKGYEVAGIMMQMQSNAKHYSAEADARKVAEKLSIPFYVADYSQIFKQKVIDYFEKEYRKGRTPNPCVVCNRYVKYEMLLDKASSMGIDYIATGHYARTGYDEIIGRYLLKKAKNLAKDQSYFLYKITQEQLSKVLFPLGTYSKDEVREIAEKYELPVAKKPDSREICFIDNENNYAEFIHNYTGLKVSPGYFTDKKGNILGEHRGIIHYTVGQRRGLGINLGKTMYVVEVDVENNRIVLGDENDILSGILIAGDLNFISIPGICKEMRVNAKIRSTTKEATASIYPLGDNKIKMVFDSPQRAITPGQSVVFYDDDVVVGGGVINSSG